jgi:kynurenine 3-monooxygenase
MPDLTEEFFRNPTSGLMTVSCYPWAADNTLLLGDAAHAIVPFYGQGMNSGFEDCTLLAEILDANPGTKWEDLFRQFERERKDDADAIAALAKRNFLEMRDHVADPRFLLRKQIAAEVSKGHPEQFLPVYSMVTFSHLPYSQGLSELHRQDQVFEEILGWENIEQEWNGSYRDKIEEILLNTQEA